MSEQIKLRTITPSEKKFAKKIKKMPAKTLEQRITRLEEIIKNLTHKLGKPIDLCLEKKGVKI